MIQIKQYVKVASLDEAYELNQKKSNVIIGGMHWLKAMTKNVDTAIDMSGLGLDKIEETEEFQKIMINARRDILAQVAMREVLKTVEVTEEDVKDTLKKYEEEYPTSRKDFLIYEENTVAFDARSPFSLQYLRAIS